MQCRDGSEIRSVELERLAAQKLTLLEHRNAQEFFRAAADLFEAHTGSSWRPRSCSEVNHRALTSAMVHSRDLLPASRRVDKEVLIPAGANIAFADGPDCNDHSRIWDVLDTALAKHPDMVLLHGGSSKGAECIAACRVEARKIARVICKSDWTKHATAAPFKRNDALLQTLPIGVIVFPGSGITGNLADKARVLGIPVWRFDGGGR